jgi:excisionase family DNA binding protein
MLDTCKDLLTVKEVSNILGVSKQMVRSLVKNQKIKSIKIGREYRITKKNLIDFINGE